MEKYGKSVEELPFMRSTQFFEHFRLGQTWSSFFVLTGVELAARGFNAAISACQRDGQWQVALALLQDMAEMVLQASSSSLLLGIVSGCPQLNKVALIR